MTKDSISKKIFYIKNYMKKYYTKILPKKFQNELVQRSFIHL